MVVSTTRNPRGFVTLRRNECLNPSVEYDTNGWSNEWFGPGGAGTNARLSDGGRTGTSYLRKSWTTAASDSGDVGWSYSPIGWNGDYAERAASAYLRTVGIDGYGRVSLRSYNKDGGLISRQDGAPQYLTNLAWSRVGGSFKTPPGTTSTLVSFWMLAGRQLSTSFRLDLDNAQIEPGSSVNDYIDGDLYAAGNGTQKTVWQGQAHNSFSLLQDADPNTAVAPTLVVGYENATQSRNVVHQLIDGGTTATLYTAGPRTGTLKLFFTTAADAEKCRLAHTGVGQWTFTDTDQPTETMVYVVNGLIRKYQTHQGLRWIVEIPFSEVSS